MQEKTLELQTEYLNHTFDFFVANYPAFSQIIKSTLGFLVGLSIPVSVFLFIAIIVTVERLKAIRKKEEEIYSAKVDMGYSDVSIPKTKGNPEITRKWNQVLIHVESQNQNDWRQAVLEADIILGELLTFLGYRGEGIGEQLKRAVKADFLSLDEAWDAHKVRNELAHAGSDYPFSQHDARRVVSLYRKVFEEFFYI